MTAPGSHRPAAEAYYRRVGPQAFEPTVHAQGAWRDTEQHMAPVSGLLTHALQTHSATPSGSVRDDLRLCRVGFEILGVIAAERSEIEVEMIRPGRTIELLQARLVIGGRTAVLAHGWRLAVTDTSEVADGAPASLPDPDSWPVSDLGGTWSGGFIDSIEARIAPDRTPGRCRAWLSTGIGLIEDEPVSDLAAVTGLADTANGIAARQSPDRWLFPNTDLTVHYFRTPRLGPDGRSRIGLDTASAWGPDGVGVNSTTLYDPYGAVGRAEQILTLRRRG